MNPSDIHVNRTYRSIAGWDSLVTRIVVNPDRAQMLFYTVMSGPKKDVEGEVLIDNFAERVVREVPNYPKNVVTMKGGL